MPLPFTFNNYQGFTMHKILTLLIAINSCISLMGMRMDEENCRNLMLPSSCCLPFSGSTSLEHETGTDNIVLQLPKEHCWSRQQYETLNANDTETYTQETFANLIKAQHDQQAIYSLARITTMIGQQPVIHYLDAAESQKATNNLNPINRIAIEKTDYYKINPSDPRKAIHDFTVLGALSAINARTRDEHSPLLINRSGESRARTRPSQCDCDQCTDRLIHASSYCFCACNCCSRTCSYCCTRPLDACGGCCIISIIIPMSCAVDTLCLPASCLHACCTHDRLCVYGFTRALCSNFPF